MDIERKLYNKFVNKLLELLDNPDIEVKELKVILDFLDNNNIQANPERHEQLKDLANKFDLPFCDEELEVER